MTAMTYPDDISRWHITMTYQLRKQWLLWHILMTYPDDISRWHINDINNDCYDISWWRIPMTYHDDISMTYISRWHITMTYQWQLWHILMTYPDDISRSLLNDISRWHIPVMTYAMTYAWWHIMMTYAIFSPVQMCFDDICDDISWWHMICHCICHWNFWYVITVYVIMLCHRDIFFTDVLTHTFIKKILQLLNQSK